MLDSIKANTITSSNKKDLSREILVLTDGLECELIEHSHFDINYRVVYITTNAHAPSLSQDILKKHQIDGVFTINHMPLQNNGERDMAALSRLIPPLDVFKAYIKDNLQHGNDITEVAVITVPNSKKDVPSIHLTDLLYAHKPSANEAQIVKNTSEDVLAESKEPLSKREDALVTGKKIKYAHTNKTLAESLCKASENSASTITYLDTSSTESIDLNQLLKQARLIRDNLINAGINTGDYALIHSEHPREIILAFWGCILGGIIPTITPTPPSYHKDAAEIAKLTGVWELLAKPVIIGSHQSKKDLSRAELIGNLMTSDQLLAIEDLIIENNHAKHSDHIAHEDDVAFICLSSGSTGTPKCIQMTHKNVLVRSRGTNTLCQNSSEDIILNWLPFDHIGSISDWHIRCIELGCQMVYCDKEAILTDPIEWINIINEYRVSQTWAPNFAYSAVNAALKQQREKNDWDLSCVKTFLTAAETVSADTIHEFTSRLASYGLHPHTIKPAFGMAEMGSGVTYNPPEQVVNIVTASRDSLQSTLQEVAVDSHNSVNFTCLGNIIPSMAMRIVTKEGELLKEGTIGQLHMKGDCVSPGYYKNESANVVFLDDGWMDTGDEGFILDKKLYLSGRTKDTIIIAGANYIPIEIEKIVESIEGVAVSYVAATAVRPASDKSESLAIFFSLSELSFNPHTIIKKIKENVPQKIGISPNYLVCLDKKDIPKTAIGKIQRSKLAAQLEKGTFNKHISEIDLLLKNERTLPDWFAHTQWVRYNHPNIAKHTYQAITFLTFGPQSIKIAKALKIIGEQRSIDIDIFYCKKDRKNSKIAKGITTIDLNKNHKKENSPPLKNQPRNIASLIFMDDFLTSTENDLLLVTQKLNQLIDTFEIKENNEKNTLSLVTLNSKEIAKTDFLSIFYQSLPSLFRSAFSGKDLVNNFCIDINSHSPCINILLNELLYPQDNKEIKLTKTERYISQIQPYKKTNSTDVSTGIRHRGLYVVTGGLGGIGQEVSTWLLSQYNAKVIIIGRSTLGSIEASKTKKYALNELQSLGEVHYICSDLSDANNLNQAIEQIESTKDTVVDGFFHLAGIVNKTAFNKDSLENMQAVIHAKAYSAFNLGSLISQRPNTLAIYFSSTLSEIPSSIAPVYALANRILENLAKTQRQKNIKSYCIAWSTWENTGMSQNSNTRAMLEAQGLYSLKPEQAIKSMALILSKDPSNSIVGINRFAKALEPLTYNPVELNESLHIVYTSEKPIQEAKQHFAAQKVSTTVASTHVDEIAKKESGAIDTGKMASIINGEEEFIEASTDIEIAIHTIWCEILKTDRISLHDNFFTLGGHSLLAAQLTQKINKRFDKNFAISLVFEASTIHDQASLIELPDEPDKTQIIALQNKGGERPLFCLCGIELYQSLADQLAPDIPVYGIYLPIEGKLFDTDNNVRINVEAMAKDYATAMRQIQKDGPYRLLGISFGGVLAYETARQLQASGCEVELLSIIDFVLPDQPWKNIVKNKSLNHLTITELMDATLAKTKHFVRTTINAISGSKPINKSENAVQEKYREAWSAYRINMPMWHDDRCVVIFRSVDETPRQGYSKTISCGWEHYMDKTPEAHIIPGDHLGVLQQPNVEKMAAHLKKRLLK